MSVGHRLYLGSQRAQLGQHPPLASGGGLAGQAAAAMSLHHRRQVYPARLGPVEDQPGEAAGGDPRDAIQTGSGYQAAQLASFNNSRNRR